MTKSVTGHELLKQVQIGDRILLVNPPVFETRYNWLRWNQPLDLLRIGAYLKSSKKCDVELFDFMLPNNKGHVQKKGLSGQERYRKVGDGDFAYTYPMWRFGKPLDALNDWLVQRRADNVQGDQLKFGSLRCAVFGAPAFTNCARNYAFGCQTRHWQCWEITHGLCRTTQWTSAMRTWSSGRR